MHMSTSPPVMALYPVTSTKNVLADAMLLPQQASAMDADPTLRIFVDCVDVASAGANAIAFPPQFIYHLEELPAKLMMLPVHIDDDWHTQELVYDEGVGWAKSHPGIFGDATLPSLLDDASCLPFFQQHYPSKKEPLLSRARTRKQTNTTPEELARRKARRRSLQQGYEKDYRQRKKSSRDGLREQWLALEDTHHSVVQLAQKRSMLWIRTVPANGPRDKPTFEELQRETLALESERRVLETLLRTETQLLLAGGFFSQSELRERINLLSSQPRFFCFEFEWA